MFVSLVRLGGKEGNTQMHKTQVIMGLVMAGGGRGTLRSDPYLWKWRKLRSYSKKKGGSDGLGSRVCKVISRLEQPVTIATKVETKWKLKQAAKLIAS